jgi:hypothetical protein
MTHFRCNRREFLNQSGACIAGVVSGPWLGAATAAPAQEAGGTPRDPDLVVFNAMVSTVDSRVPRAEAFAVKDGRFVAVGRSDEIKGLVGKKTQTYDAKQMTIVPGFIDTHNHGRGEGLLYNVLVGNPYDVPHDRFCQHAPPACSTHVCPAVCPQRSKQLKHLAYLHPDSARSHIAPPPPHLLS